MQYLGGKHYSAKQIANVISPYFAPGVDYYEPFCGALHMSLAVEPLALEGMYLSDANCDLINLWRAVRDGFVCPEITREQYTELRYAESSPTRTAAGFGLSFSGKWFGGFTPDRPHNSKYPLQALNRSFARRVPLLKRAHLTCCNYNAIQPNPGDVVYCDPPYAGTSGYAAVGSFHHADFWDWVRVLSRAGVRVFVSEYTAPEDFTSIWQQQKASRIKTVATKQAVAIQSTEHLWVLSETISGW